jgi:archaellum component FlaC
MVKNYNMENRKINSEEILQIISERKERSNNDLEVAMKFIKADFDYTKENLLKMSEHLDKLENTYNVLLKEYKTRKGER